MYLCQTNNYLAHRERLSLSPTAIYAGLRLLESRGANLAGIQRLWGFQLTTINQPHLRLPAFLNRRFWDLVAELDEDPAIGLAMARPADLGQMPGVSYLMQLMPTRLEALHCMQRFWPLVAAHIGLSLERSGDRVHLGLASASKLQLTPTELDYWFARQIRYLRSWLCAPDPVLEVCMSRPAPADTGPWDRLAGRPVHFSAGHNALLLDYDALCHARPAGPARVQLALAESLDAYARQTAGGNLLEVASSAILHGLQGGISLEALAERLHMTARTLNRALLREGWTFSGLIDVHRRYLAQDLLQDHSLTVADVADQLGYHEINSLIRAIRRWYGTTPTALRGSGSGLPADEDSLVHSAQHSSSES